MVGRVSHRLCQLTLPAGTPRILSSSPIEQNQSTTRSRLRVALACAVALAASVGLGCHDRECEAARLELAQTWETLRDTATSRQQIPEGINLTDGERDDRVTTWKGIEERAELIRSSFGTPQVTWPSADKARKELAGLFSPLQTKDEPVTRGFALTLGEADKQMSAYRGQCQ